MSDMTGMSFGELLGLIDHELTGSAPPQTTDWDLIERAALQIARLAADVAKVARRDF
jgi:hypothetical protein